MFLLYHAWRADSNPPVILLCKLTVFSIVPGRKPRRQTEAILPIRASSGKICIQCAAQTNESNPSQPRPAKSALAEAQTYRNSPSKPRPAKSALAEAQTYGNKLHPDAPQQNPRSQKCRHTETVLPSRASPSKIRVQLAAQADGNSPAKPRVIQQNPHSVRRAGRRKQAPPSRAP